MRTADDVLTLFEQRRRDYLPLHTQQEHIRRVYSGDVDIPLPDMDTTEKSSVPNLLQSGVDQTAARIASVFPQVTFPVHADNRRAQRLATTRQRVVTGWLGTDQVPVKMKKRARHLIAYASAPAVVMYDQRVQRPVWHVREPLSCFPAPDLIPGVVSPSDVIFGYTRTWGWLKANGYDHAVHLFPPGASPDTNITVVEYHDAEQTLLIAYAEPGVMNAGWTPALGKSVVLQQVPNRAGVICATVPMRIGLENSGQFDGMVGMYYQQAKLMALEVLAVEKGIFPDTYLEGRPGEVPRFVAGPFDGRSGDVNIISGGEIKTLNEQPGYMTNQVIDRLERAQRLTAGVPAEYGGESPSNVRTGRRGDAIISATIDFPVAEAQDMLALALHDENIAAIRLSRYFDGMAPRTIYVGTGNSRTSTTYISAKVFDDECDHSVTYPISGNDLNALMIGMGQRVGMGLMSKSTAAELDPYIADPEVERDRITAEGLEQALMAGIQQQAASGQLPPLVVSRIITLVSTDRLELPEAIEAATQWYAEKQAAEEQAAADAQAAAAPAAMAGLAGASPIPGPTEGQGDLASLLSTLRKPAMTITPMKGVERGAV